MQIRPASGLPGNGTVRQSEKAQSLAGIFDQAAAFAVLGVRCFGYLAILHERDMEYGQIFTDGRAHLA